MGRAGPASWSPSSCTGCEWLLSSVAAPDERRRSLSAPPAPSVLRFSVCPMLANEYVAGATGGVMQSE